MKKSKLLSVLLSAFFTVSVLAFSACDFNGLIEDVSGIFKGEETVEKVEIFGFDVKSVKAFRNGGNITVVFRYPNFEVTGLYVDMNFTCYSALRVSERHVHHSEYPITGDSECFKMEFDEFYELLHGATQRKTYDEFIMPVFVMNAVYKSMETGEEVAVNEYKV